MKITTTTPKPIHTAELTTEELRIIAFALGEIDGTTAERGGVDYDKLCDMFTEFDELA